MSHRTFFYLTLAMIFPFVAPIVDADTDSPSTLSISRLRCEYLDNPLGIDVLEPRLTWLVTSNERAQRQTAYHILVASSQANLDANTGDLWDSGKVASSETALIPYGGAPLQARTPYWWKVRVWDANDAASTWSPSAHWSMGVFAPGDWQAKWIGGAYADPNQAEPFMPLFRKTFTLDAKPLRATAYVAALGYEQLHVNGQRIGDDVCSPHVSDFDKRTYYLTYDLTDALTSGENCIGVWLGRGWYCESYAGVIPGGPFVRLHVEVTLDNGSTITLGSDESWKTHAGPIAALGNTTKGNLKGERYDAAADVPGWDTAAFDDATWEPAHVADPPTPAISAAMMRPNRVRETISALSVEPLSPDEYLFDFGRNVTAMLELDLQGTPGEAVSIRYAERPDAEEPGEWETYGTLDEYLPRTAGLETFRNHFNYHAFRYALVKGLRRPPTREDARALFVQSDYENRGSFLCSNPLLNQIYDVTMYTFRCVTAGGVSVDCPHRERLGYGGDGQITSKTALYACDLGDMYTKWLGNWRDVQDPAPGHLPNIAPSPHDAGGGPTWGGISILLPWDMYQHYGDTRVLRDNYAMMKQYIAFLDSKSENNLLKPYGHQDYGFLGDWVAPGYDQGNGRPWSPEEWRTFFNNCYCAYVNDHLSKIATVLGETGDAALYAKKAGAIREATHNAYFNPETDSYVGGGQAYMALALLSGVAPQSVQPAVLENLARTITETNNGHIDVGMHGSMFLLRCLTDYRRDDLAFLMMNQTSSPGWGYMLEQGATTMWERWDGEHSQIHSTLLAAGEWFPRAIGGIKPDPDQPGFRHIIIEPHPVGDITWANTWYDTIRGPIATNWKLDGNNFQLEVEIPANTTALIRIPAAENTEVLESGAPISSDSTIQILSRENGLIDLEVPSGRYRFETMK